MKQGRMLVALGLALLFAGCSKKSDELGCSKDTDCKNDRVCKGGECVAPDDPPAGSNKKKPRASASASSATSAPAVASVPPVTSVPTEAPAPVASTSPPPEPTPTVTQPPPPPEPTPTLTPPPPPPQPTSTSRWVGSIELVPFTSAPADMPFEGSLVKGANFRDRLGDNFVLLSRRAAIAADGASVIRLRVYHYLRDGAGSRLVREVKDGDQSCAFTDVTAFAADSLRVGDLDGDGVGDFSFAYTVGCSNEPLPEPFKLLVLESGDKYILRGTTVVQGYGGGYTPDPVSSQWPAGFFDFADKEWTRLLPRS
ncbi:MAG: hypothetical protein U0271_08430 [Polyangiaceae bacterium]